MEKEEKEEEEKKEEEEDVLDACCVAITFRAFPPPHLIKRSTF